MDPVGQLMLSLSVLLVILAVLIPAIQRRRTKRKESTN